MRKVAWGRPALPITAVAAVLLLALASCQKVAEPVPALTSSQWARIQAEILTEPPAIEHPVEAVFGGSIELMGYDLEPDVVETGQEFTITWYWRVLEKPEDRWEIFVHLDSGAQRQSLDHEAVNGLYTALYWEEGQIIRDAQTVALEPQMNGTVSVFVGLWRRIDEARMPVSRTGRGVVQEDGRLLVGTFESRRHVLTLEAPRRTRPITIDGSLNDPAWRDARRSDPFVHPNDGSEVGEARTQARVLWDDQALYVGLTATDRDVWSTIAERDGNLWEEEVLEVYLDPLGDGRNYLEIQINPLGTLFDAQFPGPNNRNLEEARARQVEGMEAAVNLSPADALANRDVEGSPDRQWTAEFRIPWASLPDFGATASEGDTLRANFYRYDRPNAETALTVAWAPVFGGSFHQPERFGEIRLVAGRGTPEEEGSGAGTGEGTGTTPGSLEGTGAIQGRQEGTGSVRVLDASRIRVPRPIIPEQLRPEGTRIHRGF